MYYIGVYSNEAPTAQSICFLHKNEVPWNSDTWINAGKSRVINQ